MKVYEMRVSLSKSIQFSFELLKKFKKQFCIMAAIKMGKFYKFALSTVSLFDSNYSNPFALFSSKLFLLSNLM